MLLLPEDYTVVPMEDATALLEDPPKLAEWAANQGYLYFRGLMPESLVAPVRALVSEVSAGFGWSELNPDNHPRLLAKPGAYFAEHGWDDPRFVEMQRIVCGHPHFHALVQDRRVIRILEIVFGETAAMATVNQCWIKLPGSPEHTTLPHQDIYYLPTCTRMWSVWYPLVETPLKTGPLAVVPGSHRKVWPHVDRRTGIVMPRDVLWASNDVHPGDIVTYGAASVHCAWSNASVMNVRAALDVRYEPSATPESILRPGGHI